VIIYQDYFLLPAAGRQATEKKEPSICTQMELTSIFAPSKNHPRKQSTPNTL